MIKALRNLVENLIEIDDEEKFCAIIGKNPSQGARSPLLWNAVFNEFNMPLKMIPLDVTGENIHNFLNVLDQDDNFLAGAVAVPYKETVFQYFFDRLDPITKKIGAVNCIFRDHNGRLTAVNTDGEGAISALKEKFVGWNYKKAIVLGSGGTAKAVAAFLSADPEFVSQLVVVSRSESAGSQVAKECEGSWVHWDRMQEELVGAELVVNCTTLGSQDYPDRSPLTKADLKLVPLAVIYDVVYDPSPTQLLILAESQNIKALGGLGMNLQQAVIACGKALGGKVSLTEIRRIMSTI